MVGEKGVGERDYSDARYRQIAGNPELYKALQTKPRRD